MLLPVCVYMTALPGKAIQKMTYYVLNLTSTHSLTHMAGDAP